MGAERVDLTQARQTILPNDCPLKTRQGFLIRPRLALERLRAARIGLVEVSAPHGFGKTSLLANWRREAIVSGTPTLWIGFDERDDASRLIRKLTSAAMRAGGRSAFSQTLAEWIACCSEWGPDADRRSNPLLFLNMAGSNRRACSQCPHDFRGAPHPT